VIEGFDEELPPLFEDTALCDGASYSHIEKIEFRRPADHMAVLPALEWLYKPAKKGIEKDLIVLDGNDDQYLRMSAKIIG
jgi:hypothetical protein